MQQPPQSLPHQRLFSWLRQSKTRQLIVGIAIILAALCCTCSTIASIAGQHLPRSATPTSVVAQGSTAAPTQASTTVPTPKPTRIPTPTPTPRPIYPPKTGADLRSLAAKGDANAIHGLHSESVGLAGCPQPQKEVTVDPAITGQQLAEDLLAYFYATHLDNPCGSIMFVYHNQQEADAGTYTAGRIRLDTTDTNGQDNLDPNATNLRYKLTLDIGDVATGQEYVVTY